jgi:hypothetical protein
LAGMYSSYINFISFFMSGLPGGITYAMLTCVKNGWISSYTEKRASVYINNYVRMPGMMYGVFLAYIACINGNISPFIAFPLCTLVAFNSIYYNTMSVQSFERYRSRVSPLRDE